jgi:hypothetical protein
MPLTQLAAQGGAAAGDGLVAAERIAGSKAATEMQIGIKSAGGGTLGAPDFCVF